MRWQCSGQPKRCDMDRKMWRLSVNLLLALLKLALGSLLGLLTLEATLRANPTLLLHGIAAPSPLDRPVTIQTYDVRYSDADVFYWHRRYIRPIPAESDRIESHVRFETDELGFPNPAPAPAQANVVILGRSFSLGAQAEYPWPRLLAEQGFKVVNLSQSGTNIDVKLDYLRNFGFPRRPQWVVLEVLPSMDVIGYGPETNWLVERVTFAMIRLVARKDVGADSAEPVTDPIYPLPLDIPGQTFSANFYLGYLAALSVSREQLITSPQWVAYQSGVLALVHEAREQGACVALLYAPTKESIYVPLALKPAQLDRALDGWFPIALNDIGQLTETPGARGDVHTMQVNATAGRDLIAQFAHDHDLPFIDPTPQMTQAALSGDKPFMVYDSHWSTTGHHLVARLVGETLRQSACP